MEAKQLRIGNKFKSEDGNILTCFGVCHGGKDEPTIVWYDTEKGFYLDESECLDIPLTEEWFLKFGFDKKEYYNGQLIHYYIPFEYGRHDSKTTITICKYPNGQYGYAYHFEIKYVHQVQNLYFALTGKELQCK